jgi:hypothetical protein
MEVSFQLAFGAVKSLPLLVDCCKGQKSNNPKTFAKIDLRASLRLRRVLTPLRTEPNRRSAFLSA